MDLVNIEVIQSQQNVANANQQQRTVLQYKHYQQSTCAVKKGTRLTDKTNLPHQTKCNCATTGTVYTRQPIAWKIWKSGGKKQK